VIGIVDGNGTTDQIMEYEYVDRNPYYGISYYRLKQLDFDGQFEYFDYVVVNNDSYRKGINASLFPNPTTPDNIKFKLQTGDQNSPIHVSMYDLSGKVFYQNQMEFRNFDDEFQINPVSTVPLGMYFIEVIQGKNKDILRLKVN